MTRATVCFLLALSLGTGCVEEELQSTANPSMTGPELSHPREPRMTGDPAPPMREELKVVQSTLLTQAEPAHVQSSSPIVETRPAAPNPTPNPTVVEPGTVQPLR